MAIDDAQPVPETTGKDRVPQGPAFDRFAAITDQPMTVLTLAWLPVLIVPLVVHVHGAVASSLDFADYAIWALFAVEYMVKLGLARHRGAFFRGHLLDLVVVVVPFLRPFRLLRLLRFLRVGTVAGDALERGRTIFTHKGLHIVLLIATALVVACAGLVTIVEHGVKGSNIHDFGQGLWWAIVTVTTVGYGDRFPVTPAGQGVAVVLMLVGIGLIGTVTATVASYFVEESKTSRDAQIVERLDRIEAVLHELRRDGLVEQLHDGDRV
jgi:voltage-gated potassium channel